MAKEKEIGSHMLLVEVSTPMLKMLKGLQRTGCYGPSVETAAQRVIEQHFMQLALKHAEKPNVGPIKITKVQK